MQPGRMELMKIINDHIWDIKVDDPNQFKTAHEKIVKKFKEEFKGRWVAFGFNLRATRVSFNW